jgi:hypothetical protein
MEQVSKIYRQSLKLRPAGAVMSGLPPFILSLTLTHSLSLSHTKTHTHTKEKEKNVGNPVGINGIRE